MIVQQQFTMFTLIHYELHSGVSHVTLMLKLSHFLVFFCFLCLLSRLRSFHHPYALPQHQCFEYCDLISSMHVLVHGVVHGVAHCANCVA